MKPKDFFALNSAVLTAFTGLGVVAGFAVDVLIAARFGLGQTTDAYFLAVTIPVVLLAVVTSSAQSVLVTAFAHARPGSQDNLFPTIFNLAGLSGVVLSLLGMLGAPLLMRGLAPGFDAQTLEMAVAMSRILFWNIPAMMMAEVLRAVLYARNRLRVAAVGNFLPGAVTLLILFLAAGPGPQLVAWAVLAGSWAGFLWQLLTFVGAGVGGYRPVLALRDPLVRQVGAELAAPLVGLLFRQGVVLAERWFGSFLPAGSISAVAYASKITQVLTGTLFSSVSTAALPALALAVAEQRLEAIRQQWRRLLWWSLAVALPLGLGLALLSRPFVALLFESGARDLGPGGAALLASVISAYALSLIPLGPFRAQQSFLYAARKPVRVAVLLFVVTAVTLLLDWPLIQWLGAPGLGISFSVGAFLALILGFRLLPAEGRLTAKEAR